MQVAALTASERLASELSYALLRFGIVARIRRRLKRLPGREERRPYWQVVVSGAEFLRRFRDSIGFGLARKSERLESVIRSSANTKVDLVPVDGAAVRRLRVSLGVSQEALAARAECSRPALSLIEAGQRLPSAGLLARVLAVLREEALASDSEDTLDELERLESLVRLFWTRVVSVAPVPGERYVYDFAVA